MEVSLLRSFFVWSKICVYLHVCKKKMASLNAIFLFFYPLLFYLISWQISVF